MTTSIELFFAGLISSILGSMVGLGGGFLLVPLLRLFFGFAPAEAAGTALALVVANSGAGAFTYYLQRRVHVKIGLLIALGGFPGSIIGAVLVKFLSPQAFDWILAALLISIAIDTVWRRSKSVAERADHADVQTIDGMSPVAAIVAGLAVGLVSSLFGIGGGVIVVPTLLYFSTLPAHAISATSHFAIALTSPVGLITHALQHDIRIGDVLALVLSGLIGGPIGARLSLKLKAKQLLYFVATALVIMAFSLVIRHIT